MIKILDDVEKQRIRAEEIFRQEVRKELEAQKEKLRGWKRVWSLVNTSFGDLVSIDDCRGACNLVVLIIAGAHTNKHQQSGNDA